MVVKRKFLKKCDFLVGVGVIGVTGATGAAAVVGLIMTFEGDFGCKSLPSNTIGGKFPAPGGLPAKLKDYVGLDKRF